LRQRLIVTFILALVLANVGLLFLLGDKMADVKSEADHAAPQARTSTSPSPEPTAEPGGRQSLTVGGDDAIFRMFSGSCDGKDSPAITVSTDTGGTFTDVGLPKDMRAVFMLTAKNADTLDLVAAGKDCEPIRFVSTDGGDTWEAAEGADVWFVNPETNKLTSPTGQVDPECNETLTLSALDDKTARAFCASGVLVATSDAGKTWTRLGSLDGVKAAAYVTKKRAFALAPDGGCETGTYESVDAGRTWTATGCLDAAPGRAMAGNRHVLAAIVGSAVFVSEDAGRNWSKAS
jgi:BNR/Asp-box repeat protein